MSAASATTAGAAAAAVIRTLPLFAGLDDADLDRLAAMARRASVPAGAVVFSENEPGDGVYFVLAGRLEVRRDAGVVLAVRGPGEFVGEQSLLTDAPRSASVVALTDADLLVVHPGDFQTLLHERPHVLRAVLHTVLERLRSTEATVMAREKLASLGTMAAGLAHELNNPAAAARRAAGHLRDAFREVSDADAALAALAAAGADHAAMRHPEQLVPPATAAPPGGALAVAEAEDAVAAWLEANDVAHPSLHAFALVAHGVTTRDLDRLREHFAPEHVGAAARALAARLQVRLLLDELERSATAISDIIGAVKSYTWLDQAPVQDVDLADTIDNTLIILRYRLKHGIDVVRDYDPDMPRVPAFGSRLNQVWTNLIANAIDAMKGRGTLTIRTRRTGDRAQVEISDTGHGIPDDVRARIFEPFFTTRAPGEGTGIGLHISWNIIVHDHGGDIRVDSEPGRTRFCVTLPLGGRGGGRAAGAGGAAG